MLKFVTRRLVLYLGMLWVASVVAFLVLLAHPDPFRIFETQTLPDPPPLQDLEPLAREYGYGQPQPVVVQYWTWLSGILRWELGLSFEGKSSGSEVVNPRLLMTLILGSLTVLLTWTMAIPMGVVAAVGRRPAIDRIFAFLSHLGIGTPNFLLAIVLTWAALVIFDLNIEGLFSPEYVEARWSTARVIDMLGHIWAPMIVIGFDGAARLARIVRSTLRDEMDEAYVETARVRGMREWRLILKYPVRVSLTPFLAAAGRQLPELFSASLIVAVVMSLPTLGPLLLRTTFTGDSFILSYTLFILMALALGGRLISDILVAWLDPRIRRETPVSGAYAPRAQALYST